MTRSGVCLSAARSPRCGRRAAAVAIGALAVALAAPAAASAAPEAPAVIATITVGSQPWGVAVNPVTGTAYVANSFSNTVSVISGRTRMVTDTIDVGTFPTQVAVNP